ncbi:hypothetical protein COEREDRAFT_97000 [Coemansia reversa NRRL 1564]|uniref:DH domain-containing protein n=1 Tax=Coemansia reversa (strain ATCC 12441 / NRRL 1564) TaxID=763665 RepID=A0A2G5BDF8_COERN|nr:hypothetical protein COEREDRAFT_97000 [Coemansia reversa NRRL 1564]|eukprot:PIA17049.1 hypothetical protein COEREDRAFT_97000 [Coemansia reversa NRRL 1564]
MVLLPTARTGSRGSQDSGAGRPSIEVRMDGAGSSPAKARMLWREGFTPHEIESSAMNAKEVKRQEVIFEIIHTEADYVKDLRIMVEVLMEPLSSLRIVDATQAELMFGNVMEILALHEEINAAFMERQRQQYPVVWDISDVLQPFVGRLRVYARYICNQDKALALVAELRRTSNNFAVFWRERQQRPECRGLPMESFLALPFQRLLKYPLLLRTLLGATEGWSQQYANGTAVAEQVDAWIGRIQDARARMDSFACIEALARAIPTVDWASVAAGEHRLAHAGAVRTTDPHRTQNGAALPPDRPATMWLFDAFAVIAAGPSTGVGPAFLPTPDATCALVLGPCQIVEVLELAQCRGTPAAYLHAVPFGATHAHKTSIVVRFASRADYTLWRAKLDEHVRRTLSEQPTLSADVLADAIARAKIVDSGPAPQCIGAVRSPPSTGLPSVNPSVVDIPTISVRDVYVPFPTPRHRSKLRRGWDMLCSKTEDITGQGIKRQLRKYGGGGKRRATEVTPSPKAHHLLRAKPKRPLAPPISPPIIPPPVLDAFSPQQPPAPEIPLKTQQQSLLPLLPDAAAQQPHAQSLPSPSFIHIPRSTVPSVANGGREAPVRSTGFTTPLRRPLSRLAPAASTSHLRSQPVRSARQSEDSVADMVISPLSVHHEQLLSSLEFGSATLACAGDLQSMSARSSFTARTLAAMPLPGSASGTADTDFSDTELSASEASSIFPEHAAERSGSTLFNPQPSPHSNESHAHALLAMPPQPPLRRTSAAPPKPLPIPPASHMSRSGFGARKPAPVFELGSAKLTYGGSLPAHSGLKTWGTSTQDLPSVANPTHCAPHLSEESHWLTMAHQQPSRNWQHVDANGPPSADSTESFCIVSREPQPPIHQSRRLSSGRNHSRTQTFT